MEVVVAIAGALLSSSVEMLVTKLGSSNLLKFAGQSQGGVANEFEKWKTMLSKIHVVLEDAEDQTTNRVVQSWLADFRDLSFDIEDLLDVFETEALQRKLLDDHQSQASSSSKIQKLIPAAFCACFRPAGAFEFDVEISSKLKDISSRLEDIIRQKDILNLRETIVRRSNKTSQRVPATSLPEPYVYGREKEQEEIIQKLLSVDATDVKFSVIPIQGMGGIGKTTLAQLVYNDDSVKNSFDLRAWVCVSDYFDVFQITKTILQSFLSCDDMDLNLLQEKLKEKLSGKRFLIVFDDVWNEDRQQWDLLCRPLETGAPGSKIIVTTRNREVSLTVGTMSTKGTILPYELSKLSDDECLSLFAQQSLGVRNFDAHVNLKDVGQKIAKRCNGLPLAAKVLGGLLRGKPSRDDWEEVLCSNLWDIRKEKNGIFPALRLSYHYLPSHLKRCFAYCAIFPKDYEFDRDELILLWMAEGFLSHLEGGKQSKDIGCSCFNDLISRSFFQKSASNESRFVMHNLIHDLAQLVSGEICLNYEADLNNKQCTSPQKVRYFAFNSGRYDLIQRFDICYAMKNLRTFFAMKERTWFVSYLSNKVICDLFPKLKYIRVLCLRDYKIKELPDSIGDLKHIRHFDLSYSDIEWLPESVGNLCNLQILILRCCYKLKKLPASIGNLINLSHLDIRDTNRLMNMPFGIGKLTNLCNLSKFMVGEGNGLRIKELKTLRHLHGQLSILGLHNVVDIRDAKDANLNGNKGLDELTLEWNDDFSDSRDGRLELQVLDSLQPHQGLKKLSLKCYGGTTFPSWMSNHSFVDMVEINVQNCRHIMFLPSFGQLPCLKVLFIEDLDAVKIVGLDFFGDGSSSNKPFQSLEVLIFRSMSQWENWSLPNEVFSSLRELVISDCPKLVGKFPSYLPSLIELNVHMCPHLESSATSLPRLLKMNVEECQVMLLKSMVDLKSLTNLTLNRIFGLSCLDGELMNSWTRIQRIVIISCDELKCVWQNGADAERLDCLKSLKLQNCPKLASFVGEEEAPLRVLKSFKSLEIKSCEALETLPDWVMHYDDNNQSVLEELDVINCPLKCFPRGKLPTTLRKLNISQCENLESLPEGIMHHHDNMGDNTTHLEELHVGRCSSLTSFPVGKFPVTLKNLQIYGCSQLETVSESMFQNCTMLQRVAFSGYLNLRIPCLECFTHLISLEIYNCPALESFPKRGLLSIPNLKSLYLMRCENLKSIPNLQTHNLTFLQIRECPGIVSFPAEGLPPKLHDLKITSCKNLKQPIMEWGLQTLTSLQALEIWDACPPDIASFPDDECLALPTGLSKIEIGKISNLKSISKGIQKLTLLKELRIWMCTELRSLPKGGIPASLGCFQIRGDCPLQKEVRLNDKGEYWPILAHIPSIEV